MRLDEVKPWRCRGGHVLGMVTRNGRGVRRLVLFREALSTDFGSGLNGLGELNGLSGLEEEIDVIAVVEGTVLDVRCSACGRVRTWVQLD